VNARRSWLLVAVALPGCISADTEQAWRWQESRTSPQTWRDDEAEALFRARCKPCHGEDGKHKTQMGALVTMPDLTDPDWQDKRSDEEIKKIISQGSSRPGSRMVGFETRLTPAEMDMLVPYIRQFKGK
jgi:mono/diheme cytochrome c family protein